MQKNQIKDNSIFRLMNTFSDILFFVFICLNAVLVSSYLFNYKPDFIQTLRFSYYLCGWSEVFLSFLSLIVELSFGIFGHKIYAGRSIWLIIRAATAFALLILSYLIEYFFNGEFTISL